MRLSSRRRLSLPARLLLLALLLAGGCGGADRSGAGQQRARSRPDPSVAVLDRIIARSERIAHSGLVGSGREDCLGRATATGAEWCPVPASSSRTHGLRLALDPRYQATWPDWEERLVRTVDCVNLIFEPTGTRFEMESAVDWDPGSQRHDLRSLLGHIRREVPWEEGILKVGMVVWEKRRVFASAGGEIGLSQAGACVVPSWPRVENDCATLAHELGHLVGARHVPGKGWLMGWTGHVYHLPAGDPIARVVATYRIHPRNLEALRVYHLARHTPQGLRLPRGCRRYLAWLDLCWGLTGLR